MFLLVLTAILLWVNLRAYRWLSVSFPIARRWRRAILGTLFGALFVMLVGRLLSRAGHDLPLEGLWVAAFGVQLAALISVLLLVPLDVAGLFWRAVAKCRSLLEHRAKQSEKGVAEAAQGSSALQPLAEPISRRAFGMQALVGSSFLIGSSSSVYGSLVGRHDYVIEEVPIRVPGLARAFEGFSIVQLSDLHIGQFIGAPELRAAEDLVRQAAPDLIVLTGDLLDHDARFAEQLGRFVRRLSPLAREGVAMVSGNHDFYAGITPTVAALQAGGARVLRNQSEIIGDASAGFALLGVDDVRATRFGSRPDLGRALDSLPKLGGRIAPARDLPRVLLCHNPVYFKRAQGHVALQLSGHTHGGQVNPLLRPADWVLPYGWVAGLYEASGSQLYVNRGFGTAGPPARVGAAPEVSRFVLTV